MNHLLRAAVLGLVLLSASGSIACEKHINGHQNGTDTNTEASSR
jgi:hypothetical protein